MLEDSNAFIVRSNEENQWESNPSGLRFSDLPSSIRLNHVRGSAFPHFGILNGVKKELSDARELIILDGFLKPILFAADEKMSTSKFPQSDEEEIGALVALLQIKAAVSGDPEAIAEVIPHIPLVHYILHDEDVESYLQEQRALTHALEDFRWESLEKVLDATLTAFNTGLDRFLSVRDLETAVDEAKTQFKSLEDYLLNNPDSLTIDTATGRVAELDDLQRAAELLSAILGSSAPNLDSYGSAWTRMKAICDRNGDRANFKAIGERLTNSIEAGSPDQSDPIDLTDSLTNKSASPPDDVYLDRTNESKGRRLFEYRYLVYRDMLQEVPLGATGSTLGRTASLLAQLKAKTPPVYDGEIGDQFGELCSVLANFGLEKSKITLARIWRREMKSLVSVSGRFPLVGGGQALTVAEFRAIVKDWHAAAKDLPAMNSLSRTIHLPPNIEIAIGVTTKICSLIDLLWLKDEGKIAKVLVKFSGEEPKVIRSAPGNRDESPLVMTVGINHCAIRVSMNGKPGKTIVRGTVSSEQTGLTPVSDGIIIEYQGRSREGMVSKEIATYGSTWGILRAMAKSPTNVATPSIKIYDEALDATFWVSLEFVKGTYDPKLWISKAELDRAFK